MLERIWKERRKSNSYYRVIWLGCLSACIPILLGGIVFYYTTMSRMTEQVGRDSQTTLHMIMNQTEKEMLQIENEAVRLSLDPSVNRAFLNPEYTYDYSSQLDLIAALTASKTGHSEIKDILFYKRSPKLLLSHSRGYVYTDDIRKLINEAYIQAMEQDGRWLSDLTMSPPDHNLTYIRKLPTMNFLPSGALIIRLNTSDIFASPSSRQRFVVFDRQQRLLYDSAYQRLSLHDGIYQQLAANRSDAPLVFASFQAKESDGETYHYTVASTASGRQYLLGIPQSEITNQLSGMKWWFILTIVTFLAVGAILSYFSSRRAYHPILELKQRVAQFGGSFIPADKAQDEVDYINACIAYLNLKNETMDAYIEVKKPSLRERLLLQLLERVLPDSEGVRAELADYGVPRDRKYIVMVVTIEKLYKEKRFPAGEEHVIDFAVRNVMEEIRQQQEQSGYHLTASPGKTVALFHYDPALADGEIVTAAKRYAEQCIHALHKYLKFTASGGIGGVSPSVTEISVSLAEANRALECRVNSREEHVFYYGEVVPPKKAAAFMYPLELEHEILRSLETDDMAEAEAQLRRFSDTVSACESYAAVTQCYTLLLSSMLQSLERHRKGSGALYEQNLFDQLKQRHTADEIREWFVEGPFQWFRQELQAEVQLSTGQDAVPYVCRYVKEHISVDVSLMQCAELVHMSAAHLSRLFKKELGISFIDYVTNCKLDEAKRLLIESELPVAEISRMVGYTDRNLNRVFRSKLDMSPIQYRKKFR